jgi:pimeloyl-ACP methyl ester carboxylesterase
VPACQQANPNLAADLMKILKRLDQAPAKAAVRPTTGDPVTVTMSRGDFLYAMRGMLYNAGAQNELPAMITQAAATGDVSAFAQRYWARAVSMGRSIAYGMHLSVFCPEDVNVLTDARVAAETATTRIGNYIVNEYRTACALWPKAPVAADFRTPVTARVPVLLVSGKYDPVTPPEFGERIARSLPLARHIVVSTSGHGSASGCPRVAALYVLSKGTLEGLPEVCR